MQLRVARLCLDCENLHVDDRCPVCGSEQNAFLSQWLPSEERRKWKRVSAASRAAKTGRTSATAGSPDASAHHEGSMRRMFRRLNRWLAFEFDDVREPGAPPRTRQSDRVPSFNFDEDKSKSPAARPIDSEDPLPQSHKH